MSVKLFFICLLIVLVIIAYILVKACIKTKKELRVIENKLKQEKEILKKERENEEEKKKLHTGNSDTDFINSLDLLRKHTKS